MIKAGNSIEDAKRDIESFFGKDVLIRYNKGRNNILHLQGRVEEIYPNVFVMSIKQQPFDRLCVSYAEVICGELQLKLPKQKQ